jgi:uncharacterized protein DUF2721
MMDQPRIAELIPVLQVAIGPVILISGIGLLLLSMTNRFGRIIDRSRILAVTLREGSAGERQRADAQVVILWRRAQLVRRAIALACVSLLLAAVLMMALFVATLARFEIAWLVVTLFVACLGALVGSLIAFIQEINESLIALRLDLRRDEA